MKRILAVFVVVVCALQFCWGQGNQGVWDPPFNHVVPPNWQFGQPGHDGEQPSQYTNPDDPHRFLAGHMALIPVGPHRGKLLVWNFMRPPTTVQFTQYWSIVDVSGTTPVFLNFELPMPTASGDLFCSGHAWTKDGHLLVAGGNNITPFGLLANQLAFRFDPLQPTGNAMWRPEPNLFYTRWYPNVIASGTDAAGVDRMLVFGGTLDVLTNQAYTTYEAFDPTNPPTLGTWQVDPTTSFRYFDGPNVNCADRFHNYPRPHLLTSGKVFFAGMPELGYRVDHQNVASAGAAPTWEVHTTGVPYHRDYASTFLFPNLGGPTGGFQDIVFRLGGALKSVDPTGCGTTHTQVPLNLTEFCFADLPATDPNWNWSLGPNMLFARGHQDTVVLPDSSVAIFGGKTDFTSEFVTASPVLQTELFNDTPFAFRQVASAAVRRGYHSTAMLLPDGRVLTGGGEEREADYEIYNPPYLTNGTVRPAFRAVPFNWTAGYNAVLTASFAPLPTGVSVQKVVLMAPGAMTHHQDMHARYVETEVIGSTATTVQFRTPPTSYHAPKGYYMVFLVTNPQGPNPKGTPSAATWIRLQ